MRITIIFLSFLFTIQLFGQSYPQDYFRSPIDFPIYLAGTFGELRSNHFHSGIDIKTEGVEGKNIYAVADGYVARVKISPYGYGKAIYIRHPNGYTSVYGHLQVLQGELAEVVKEEQYRRKSFAIDYFPEVGSIKVTKGQVFALSGNSGSSGGPHLHFEIRDSKTEHPINPLFFGFKVKDHVKPTIKGFYLYAYDNGVETKRTDLTLTNAGSYHKLTYHDTLAVPPKFYFGVNAIDKLDGFNNQNGLYSIEVYSDDMLVFDFKAKEFSFARSRYLNAYIDYSRYKAYGERIQKTFIEPHNKLRMIQATNQGLFTLKPNEVKNILVKLTDFEGNLRSIKFVVKQSAEYQSPLIADGEQLFKWDQANQYKADGVELNLPVNVLYHDIHFRSSITPAKSSAYSQTYHLHTDTEPLHTYCELKIKPNKDFSPKALSKACIVSISSKGQIYYEGGKWDGDYIVTKTRSFGTYYISADTLAPIVKGVNVYDGKSLKGIWTIKFKISDDLSGIKSYKAYVDGGWILMDYDAKNNLLSYQIDEHFPVGKHELKLIVSDAKGNQTIVKYQLIR